MSIGTKLSASGLFKLVYAGLETMKDIRAGNQKVSLADAAMSAFAVFSLKDPSLLAFDERRATEGNLKRVYRIQTIPCDTQMRTILDEVDPDEIRPRFKEIFQQQFPL
jgi:hypothetical protein